jgi:hypothetical protein
MIINPIKHRKCSLFTLPVAAPRAGIARRPAGLLFFLSEI